MKKLELKNIDIRKFLGTIIGGVFFVCCILYFTYAYYEWKSTNTIVDLVIQDLSAECSVGADIEVSNIGPVLNYQDGVKAGFSVDNQMAEDMAIDLRLDIESISDNLRVESFKYALVTDTDGGTNYDYNNPVLVGDFSDFEVGSNVITTALAVSASITQYFQFIIYIDGNMYNNPNIMDNSLVANLMIGNCGGDSVPLDSLIYQAVYSATDNSLTFTYTKPLKSGDTYNNKAVTAVYTGFTTNTYSSSTSVPWYKDGIYKNITTVDFETVIKPKSTLYWFYGFSNLTDIDLNKLDTSSVTTMGAMFQGCSSLVNLDLSNFDTRNVTSMSSMFRECTKLTSLDLSSFDTRNVTDMNYMFYNSKKIVQLDVSSFDTKKVTNMKHMFENLEGITDIDLSKFNTSKVTEMGSMFTGMTSLKTLNLTSFNTSSVTNMSGMFQNCTSLTDLKLTSFNTNSVTNMYAMFYNCSSLTSLDLSSFNTNSLKSMNNMFSGCSNLVNLDIRNFNTSNVTDMGYLFAYCRNLSNLNVGSFNTSSVTNMSGMFYDCRKINVTITIRNANVTNYSSMLYNTATATGSKLTLNYINATDSLVTSMVSTANGNVIKGGQSTEDIGSL